jgi:hypothetical protein
MQQTTSRLANKKMTETGTKDSHYDIIYNTLLSLPNRVGTATDIALKSKLDYVATNRRLSEMIGKQMIEVIDIKGKTATGNPCRRYRAIVEQPQPTVSAPTLF